MCLEEIPNGNKVSQRFGHFFSFYRQKSRMKPIIHEWLFSGKRFHLRDFSFMMRENQITRSAVNIVLMAKMFFGNGCVFNVPAGSAVSKFAFPRRNTLCFFLLVYKFP